MRLGASRRGPLLRQKFLEAFRSKGLASTPRTRIADNLCGAIVNRDCAGVGFDDEPPADIAVGNAITIAVEGGVDPKGETASSPTPYRSMIIRFLPLVQRFMMTLSVKRRRAMLASIPIKE